MAASPYACSPLRSGGGGGGGSSSPDDDDNNRVAMQQQPNENPPPTKDLPPPPPSDEVIFSNSDDTKDDGDDDNDDNYLSDELDESTLSSSSSETPHGRQSLADDISERSVDTNGAVRGVYYYSTRLCASSISLSSLSYSESHHEDTNSPAEEEEKLEVEDDEYQHHGLKIDEEEDFKEEGAASERPKSPTPPPPRRFRAEDLGFDTRFVRGTRECRSNKGGGGFVGSAIPKRSFSHDDAYYSSSYGNFDYHQRPDAPDRSSHHSNSSRGQDRSSRHHYYAEESQESEYNRYYNRHMTTSSSSHRDYHHQHHQLHDDSYDSFDQSGYRGERRYPSNDAAARNSNWNRSRSFEDDYHHRDSRFQFSRRGYQHHRQANHLHPHYPQELRRWSMVEQSIDPLPRSYHHDLLDCSGSDPYHHHHQHTRMPWSSSHSDSRRELATRSSTHSLDSRHIGLIRSSHSDSRRPVIRDPPFHHRGHIHDSDYHSVDFATQQQQPYEERAINTDPQAPRHRHRRRRSTEDHPPQLLSSRFLNSQAREEEAEGFHHHSNTAIGSAPGAHHMAGPPPEYYYNDRQNDGIYQDDDHRQLDRCSNVATSTSWTRIDDTLASTNSRTWQDDHQQILWDELEKLQTMALSSGTSLPGRGYLDQQIQSGPTTKKIQNKSSQLSFSSSLSSCSSSSSTKKNLSRLPEDSYEKLASNVLPTTILKGQYSVCPTPAHKHDAASAGHNKDSSSFTRRMVEEGGKGHGEGDAIWVEISPGIKEPLRRTEETRRAVARDFFSPVSCRSCSHDLFCITDCKFFACPKCECISSVLDNNNSNSKDDDNSDDDGNAGDDIAEGRTIQRHGLGVAFTVETLCRMQSELMRTDGSNPSSSSSASKTSGGGSGNGSRGGSKRRSLASNAA